MNSWEAFYGPNVGYALELYERYLDDPDSVDEETRRFFQRMGGNGDIAGAVQTLARPATRTARSNESNGSKAESRPRAVATNGSTPSPAPAASAPMATAVAPDRREIARIVAAARLARSIREYGHLAATIDPLGTPGPNDPMLNPATHGINDRDLERLPASIVWPSAGPELGTCRDAIDRLCAIYCGPIGYEFDHVQDFDERAWLHAVVENGTFRAPLTPEQQRALLLRLTEVEGFERFLHTTYQGQKRFSLEGNDMLVPMVDQIVVDAEETGVGELLIGMAHRGRLNILAHTLRKPVSAIFSQFHTAARKEVVAPSLSNPEAQAGGGDVKYHRGAQREIRESDDGRLIITLADNPSHLEYVNPVVEGFARAAQDDRSRPGAPTQDPDRALALTIHGDAAFPGEGVVAETLNLSRLPGYRTGGTLHLIANNQVGFTTVPEVGRSTLYASDLAKGFEIPIVHVNGDDPEACMAVIRLAYAYRQRFHKDFLIDLVGYRRWGHNEGDEPSYTQPDLYTAIGEHPTVRKLYAERLVAEGVVTADEAEAMLQRVREHLRQERDAGDLAPQAAAASANMPTEPVTQLPTAVPADTLRELNEALLSRPVWFKPNPKLERVILRRREAIDRPHGVDWAFAEILAFGSILADGTSIRLAGQDTERGTFSQRHLVLHGIEDRAEYTPLQSLPQARASFAVYNSPLTEAAVIGFEYGYSVHAPRTLVIWEAQYGDFANAGQVLIDQFIAAARAKWGQQPALVLLLPHGYEGQGPEHSSARLERFLQLSGGGNMRVTNPTTAAQYFHLLRLQAATLPTDQRRPLVIMTPKSLLRRTDSSSDLADLATGSFQPVLDDPTAGDRRETVERLILCSGKVAIDLATSEEPEPVPWVAVARVEQLYPFPAQNLRDLIAGYPNVREVVWLQEEPRNMGAWSFMAPRLQEILPAGISLAYIGRPDRASTATGFPDLHEWEQAHIVEQAYGGERAARIETRREPDVD
jgi:2-oxoglutarate dehydrogenase E1 component